MPVKAKPVLYVKICTLYGDGFYYIPGTDTCIKMGGYARIQAEYNAGGGGVNDGTLSQLLQARYNRQETNDIDYRVRGAISWDVRQQTEYGTLRTYIRTGVNQSTPADGIAGVVFWDRAFIQFAGFTVGKAQSFFDTVTYGGAFTYHNVRTVSDTGASGWNVWAYTAQFGNGFSGTLSLEDPNRNRSVWDNTLTGFIAYGAGNFDNAFGAQTAANNGMRMPDVIGNCGSTRPGAMPASASRCTTLPALLQHRTHCRQCLTYQQRQQRASRRQEGLGDRRRCVVQHSRRPQARHQRPVVRRCLRLRLGGRPIWTILQPGTSTGFGYQADGIFTTGGEIELTRVWNVIAFYEHVWNKNWRTTWFGGYVQTEYNSAARDLINSRTGMPRFAELPRRSSPTRRSLSCTATVAIPTSASIRSVPAPSGTRCRSSISASK